MSVHDNTHSHFQSHGSLESSSFDSNNSFYSTDSSSSTSLVTLSFHILDEDKFDQQYTQQVNTKIHQFIEEIGNDSLFKPLVNLPTVQVDTSVDPATPFCFRASAQFPNSANNALNAFALFVDLANRGSWDAMCHNITVLKQIDPLTFIYHLQLKASWPTTARDSLALVAFRKLSDGRYVSVAWSIVDDELCPPDHTGKNYIRMNTRISANLFTPTDSGFRLDQLIDGDPKGNIPAYLIKKVSSASFPATIESIKRVLSSRKPVSSDHYHNLVTLSEDGTDCTDSVDSTLSVNDTSNALREIKARLAAIEDQLNNKDNLSWQVWTPLAISSLSLLLLLNLNLRKK